MTEEEIRDVATELVKDYMDDGLEFLTVAELAGDWVEDGEEISDDDLRRIHGLTRSILTELAGNL